MSFKQKKINSSNNKLHIMENKTRGYAACIKNALNFIVT
jgi:hypothetical protein